MSAPSPKSPSRKQLLLLFVCALLLRLFLLWQVRDNPFFDSPIIDAQTYDEQAQAFANGQLTNGQAFWQPPLYPWFLGLIYTLFGRSLPLVLLIQAGLGALVSVLTALLAARRFSLQSALLAGMLTALCAPLIFAGLELGVPVLSVPLELAALLLLTPPSDRSFTARRLLAAGFVLGLAAITRPTVLLFAAAILFSLPWLARGRLLQTGSAFLVGVVLPILPVTYLNWREEGHFVPISTNAGINFYIGNNPLYDQVVGVRPGVAWRELVHRPLLEGHTSEATASGWWLDKALSWMMTDPLAAARLWLKKGWLLLQSYELPRNLDQYFFADQYAPLLNLLLPFGLILALAIPALWQTRRTPGLLVWRLFLLSQALGVVAFFVTGRYRLSLIPLLAIFAGFSIHLILSHLSARRPHQSLALLTPVGLSFGLLIQDPFQLNSVDQAEGFNLVGKAHSNRERHALAMESFERARAIQPENADVLFNLGREYQLKQDCSNAIPLYLKTLEYFPHDRDTLNNLAICYLANNRAADGIPLLETAVKFYPQQPDLFLNLGQAYLNVERLDDAQHILSEGLVRHPDVPTLKQALDQVRQVAGVESTLKASRQAADALPRPLPLEHRPSDAAIKLNNEGHRLLASGRLQEATGRFILALQAEPGYATAWSNLGQAYFAARKLDEAQDAFERAIRLQPDHWMAHLGLALTWHQRPGGDEEARRLLEHVRTHAPEAERQRAAGLQLQLGMAAPAVLPREAGQTSPH